MWVWKRRWCVTSDNQLALVFFSPLTRSTQQSWHNFDLAWLSEVLNCSWCLSVLSGVRARKKWGKWAEIIMLSKLPASLPKHQSSLHLPWAVCLLYWGTPASYLQGFLILILYNYSLPSTFISTLASLDSAEGKILHTRLSSLHEPEISDTYLNFLFAAAGRFFPCL